MLTMMKITPRTITTAETAFKSLFNIALIPYLENPGQLKISSTKKAFPTREAKSNPRIETVGIKDGLRRYLSITTRSGTPNPFADAM